MRQIYTSISSPPTSYLYLILYVDDILLFCHSSTYAEEIRENPWKKYRISSWDYKQYTTDLGLYTCWEVIYKPLVSL